MNDENKNSISSESNTEKDTRLNLLYEIGRILASLETMNEAAPQILEAVCRHLRFELGELWCLHKGETVLKLESVWHLPAMEKFVAESRRFEFPIGDGLPGKVWAKNAPVWIENLSGEEQLPRRFFAEESGLQSGFAFPILLGERFLGAFSFFSTDARRADDALLQMFAAVGNHIGQFIKHEKIESSLRESEDRYRAFIEQSTEGIWRFELDEKLSVNLPVDEQVELGFRRGYLAECNDAMARMYDLERAEDLVGSRIADLLDMSDAANVEYLRSFIESGYNLIDAESHEKDRNGNDKYFLNSLVGTIENGFLVRVWGTQRDITAQKKAEQATRESEESYRIVAETASDAIIKIDEDSRILFVNSSVERVFGYTVGEMLGQSLTMIVPENLRERHHAGFRRYLETGVRHLPWEGLEIPALHADGHTFPMEISFGEYHQHGSRFFIGIARDITERKRTENRLTLISEISELARAFDDPNEFLYAVSKAVGEHLQVKRCLFNEIDIERDLETVHRDYCSGVESVAGEHRISDYSSITSADMIAGTTVVNNNSKIDPRTADDYAKVYEPNSERAYVAVPLLRENCWVASLWVSDDKPREWNGQEISLLETVAERTWTAIEKLRVDVALRESEERFAKAFNSSPLAVTITSLNTGKLVEVNETFVNLTGYSRAEAVGRTTDELRLWEKPHDREIELAAVKRDGQVRDLEYSFRLRDGAEVVGLLAAELLDLGGKPCVLTVIQDITRRKRAEENLKHQKTLLEALTESVLDGILIVSPEGKMLHFNQHFLDIWNFSAEVVESQSDERALDWAANQTTNPQAFLERVGNVYQQPDREVREEVLMRDGRVYERFGAPILSGETRLGWVWTFRDITERKLAEKAVRESEERYRSLFETMDEGFCLCEMIFDQDGKPSDYRFLETNPAFERMTGLARADGRTARELLPNLEARWFEIYGKVVLTGEAVRFVDGSDAMNRWFDVYASHVGDADSRRFAILFTDITERRKIENEREQLLASEQQAREIAEEANHAKDEFIALVSHELRSPLNAMLGWTRILQNQNPDEETKNHALDIIVRNARSQSRLIEDLLDIARVSKGKLRVEMQPTELIPIINAAVEIIKPAAAAGNIKLSQTLDRAADLINGDVDRLRQVVENLLSNALKFTPPDGSIEVRLERENNTAKIVISDTGQGISREFLPQIFERFKQADASATRRHGGLGIGLSLARDLVELHGGAISAESAGEGQGATFIVTLPLRVVAPLTENSDEVETMDAQGKLSGFWILAVDDEADARELVSFMLQINGAKVTTANSAVEALDILKSSEGRLPDILLSDISMPNESGYALLEKIRALPREHGGQIPAVALTAFNRPEDREAAYEAGFQKHLGKPVEPNDLISAIIEMAGAR